MELLVLEKELNKSSPIDKEITNEFVRVRYEHNKFVTYDWDSKKTNRMFNFDSFIECYKSFMVSEQSFHPDNNIPKSDLEYTNVCMDKIRFQNTWFILDENGNVKAFVSIVREDSSTMDIFDLCVSEPYRSMGYGIKMMNFVEFISIQSKVTSIVVLVWDNNIPAKSLYLKCGFKIVEKRNLDSSSESYTQSLEELVNNEQIKRTGKYTYNNKKRVGGRRRFKCLDCGQRFHEFMQLYHHAEKFHKDLIGDEDVYRYLYEKRNPGPYICPICNKNPREWNEKTHKYRRICRSPECIKKAREKYSKNMKRVYGTDNLLTDPARQEEMLKNRSISGIYTFEDGVKISYVGEYEHDFIMHCVDKLGYGSMDVINCPSKLYLNYYDPYTQKNRFYMPDFYIPKYNLVIEIKDGSKFPRDSKAKAKLKEAAVIKANKFNYVKIVEKVYSDFDGLIEMFNNDAYAEKHFDKDFVFIIPEDTSK